MADSSTQRICPVCGHLTDAALCPKEGASTVVAQAFSKPPRNYAVGDLVGNRYRITGALGSGGYAAVYSAEHTGTGQAVAVKLMAFDPTADGGKVALRRFFREARITAGLKHPNTVRVFDAAQDDGGCFYIAMELLRGESLEDLLKRVLRAGGALSVEETLEIMIPVLESLQEAHEQELVHRDLKPANIFLVQGEDGHRTAKVLDFGIARTLDSSLTVGGTIPGTPPFMSPEQCRGETVDGRSDLYSLAVLLFLCVVGRLPYHDTNVLRLMRMHAFDPPPNPRTMTDRPLPDGLVDLLMRTMAKQPEGRPESAAAMAQELREIRDGTWFPLGFAGDTLEAASVTAESVAADAAMTAVTLDSEPAIADLEAMDTESHSVIPVVETSSAPASAASPAAAPSASAVPSSQAEAPGATATDAEAPGGVASSVAADPGAAVPAAAPTAAPEPAAAPAQPPAVAPAASGNHRLMLALGLAVLVLGGIAVGLWLGRRTAPPAEVHGPGQHAATKAPVDQAQVRAKIAFEMAQKAADPGKKLDYAREAMRLDPNHAAAKALVAKLEAQRAKATQRPAATPDASQAGSGGDAAAGTPTPSAPSPKTGSPVPAAPKAKAAARPTKVARPRKPARKSGTTQRGKAGGDMAPALMD